MCFKIIQLLRDSQFVPARLNVHSFVELCVYVCIVFGLPLHIIISILLNSKFQLFCFLLMELLEIHVHSLRLARRLRPQLRCHISTLNIRINIVIEFLIELIGLLALSSHLNRHQRHVYVFLNLCSIS